MYTIKHAAELTGVPVATLRAWERRYGVVTPGRTDAGYRLYDARSLHALRMMRDLVDDGWSPRQAAAEVGRRMATGDLPPDPGLRASGRVLPAPPPDGPAAPAPAAADQLRTATADQLRTATADLLGAATDLDADRLTTVLDDHFSRGSFETVVDGWLMPALEAVGRAWEDGRLGVAGEHLVSCAVHRRLAAAFEAAGSAPHGPEIVVGLPPGARHELGLLAFATAARRVGLAVTYLGADVPAADWPGAVAAHGARCAVLSVPTRADLAGLAAVLEALEPESRDVVVAVGGSCQDLAPTVVRRLGHDLGAAAARLAAELGRVP